MNDPPDLDDLAQQYLDLWQDQASAVARDPEVLRALSSWLAMLGSGSSGATPMAAPALGVPGTSGAEAESVPWPAAMMAAALAGTESNEQEQQKRHDDADGRDANGTPAAAASSGDGAGDLEYLLRRIADLEDRLAALETARNGASGAGSGTSGGPGGDSG